MSGISRVLAFALEHPWAITPSALSVVADVFARKAAGRELTAADLEAALVNRKNLPQPTEGAVAVVPVYGVLAPRANMLTDISGGTSYEELGKTIREAVANSAIGTIVLDVDSPGGNVAGATELAREIAALRRKKPILAVAQYAMCSAAYWIASAATEIIAAPSARVGSIGVYAIHDDLSKALEQEGINRTYIAAGKYKVEANETEPLSDEAREHLNAMIATSYDTFVGDISKHRGVAVEDVRAGYGQGRVLTAADALAAGMVDSIGTLDETVTRALSAGAASDRRRATALAETAHFERALFNLSI